MTYKIRKLEWESIWKGHAFVAQGIDRYTIQQSRNYWLDINNIPNPDVYYDSLEEAKAAAQAHHEQQLMKWLEPVCHICEGNDPDGWQVNCPIHDDISKMKIYGNTFHEHAPTKYSTPKDKD